MVFAYNTPGQEVPTRAELPVLVASELDAIYVVDKYSQGIDTADDIKFKASFADVIDQIGIKVKDDDGYDLLIDGLLGMILDKD